MAFKERMLFSFFFSSPGFIFISPEQNQKRSDQGAAFDRERLDCGRSSSKPSFHSLRGTTTALRETCMELIAVDDCGNVGADAGKAVED